MAGKSLLDTTLNRLKLILILSGLNLERFNRPQTIKRRLIYIFNFIWLNSDIICAIFYLIDGVKNGTDMTELTYLAPCSMLSAVSNLKSLYIISYNNYVNNLIDELRALDVNSINYNTNIKNKIEKEERRFLNIVINLLNILNIGMVVNFTFSPLILIAINYFRTKKVELMLPFLDVYPFDPLNIKYWPLVYIKQIWSECIVLLEICAADYFYYICCTYIRIQFRLLSYEIENLIPIQDTDDQDIRSKLLKLIKWHQHLISVTNTLELIYSKSTLFNFFSSSVIICLTGFNVTAIDNLAFGVTFLTFLFMSLLQIFFLCLFGDMIMRSSQEVSDAAYNCLWYTVDCRLIKYLMIVQIRAQKPCKLTAMGFADVNLRAFTRVLSSSWSYFCLLNTIYTPSADGI
ncbi:PREDICTED: odorant receptor 4-like [Papilio polytes]|uniref:odorant receptor 4-like n=1 Tax=Papilio polytes TaxID=76194 RepID=UPI000675F8C1|nr:PREDICTED: odorant receptor 4-like [Papilio polytes]WCC57631.1 odorant receptor 41 [Papilio polytes]